MTESPFLTPKEAASFLRYPSTNAFWVSVYRNKIPRITIGARRVVFDRDVLINWMRGRAKT